MARLFATQEAARAESEAAARARAMEAAELLELRQRYRVMEAELNDHREWRIGAAVGIASAASSASSAVSGGADISSELRRIASAQAQV